MPLANGRGQCLQFSKAECKDVKAAIRKGLTLPKIIDFGMALRMNQTKSHASNVRQCAPALTPC
jgi:hypothetical protein